MMAFMFGALGGYYKQCWFFSFGALGGYCNVGFSLCKNSGVVFSKDNNGFNFDLSWLLHYTVKMHQRDTHLGIHFEQFILQGADLGLENVNSRQLPHH